MIGVYGGTFDPVHYGHLRTALEIKETVQLDEVRFLPCRQPPHRQAPEASPEQRYRMLELALIDSEPGFSIDSRELRRPGPSYMVDTLGSLRAENGQTPVCLIVGMDAFRGLLAWHRWTDLFELAHFIVMQRPGNDCALSTPLAAKVVPRLTDNARSLQDGAAGQVLLQEVIQLDVSATRLRQALQSGRSARYLTPDTVLAYIRREGLYRSA